MFEVQFVPQEAVVPHKRVEVNISLSSFSGFPATINGQVCGKNKIIVNEIQSDVLFENITHN